MLGWSVAGPKAFHCRLVKFYVDAAYEFLIMADMLSRAERSARMALIRSKDTKPELIVRKALWAAGYRYRLRVRGLPGRPDLVFPSLGVVVFVHEFNLDPGFFLIFRCLFLEFRIIGIILRSWSQCLWAVLEHVT